MITRRAVTTDTGAIRNSVFAGVVASGTTYGTLAAPGPVAVCIAVGGSAALAMLCWRIWEGDRRAYETRERAEEAPPVSETRPVRPFVPTTNGNTTRIANIRLPLHDWQALIDDAAANNWTISRDRGRRFMPREYYADWSKTVSTLERAGMVQRQGNQTRLTEHGLAAIVAMGVSLPQTRLEHRPLHRADGRRADGRASRGGER
jgi:hypothetical protein